MQSARAPLATKLIVVIDDDPLVLDAFFAVQNEILAIKREFERKAAMHTNGIQSTYA